MENILTILRSTFYPINEEKRIERAARLKPGTLITAINNLEDIITKGKQYVVKSISPVREDTTKQLTDVLYRIVDDNFNPNPVSYRNFRLY